MARPKVQWAVEWEIDGEWHRANPTNRPTADVIFRNFTRDNRCPVRMVEITTVMVEAFEPKEAV